MSEDPFSERLKRLEDRINAANDSRGAPVSRAGAKFTQGSLAWRMVTELVAGMLLGLGIGWGLDSLLGTQPAFLVVFALLGFASWSSRDGADSWRGPRRARARARLRGLLTR